MRAPDRADGTAPGSGHRTPVSLAERVLHTLGVEPAFAEAVLGDLAEEYAERATVGVSNARQWYAAQALRSAPHLIRSATRHAAGRARLAGAIAAVALVTSGVLLTHLALAGPPAQLVAGTGDTVVVNYLQPVRLPTRVLDETGRVLSNADVRYRWLAGAPVAVSNQGVVTCARHGDATVRASLGALATDLFVRCRPVREVSAGDMIDFVLGDPPRDVALEALGVDGKPVTLLGASLSVEDSSVATLHGLRVIPRAAGETALDVRIGDRGATTVVRVFEPVRSLEGLRPDQRLVAAHVRLARGAAVRWQLPTGRFYLFSLPSQNAHAAPAFAVDGAVMCMPALRPGVHYTRCVVREPGAWVTVANGSEYGQSATVPEVDGVLALHRDRLP